MKILVTIGAGLLLTTTALAQVNEEVVDGKKLDKEKMELHDYLPAIHGTIRAKYEYQTATDESTECPFQLDRQCASDRGL